MSQMSMRLNEQKMSTEARFKNTDVRQNTSLVTLINQLRDSEVRQNSDFNAKVKSVGNNLKLTIGNVQQAVNTINNRGE